MKKVFLIFLFILNIFSPQYAIALEYPSGIIDQIIKKNSLIFKDYDGVQTKQEIVVKHLKPDTQEVLIVEKMKMITREFYYSKGKIKILSHTKNGESVKFDSKFKPRKDFPTYPFFDEQVFKHYSYKINGSKKIKGHDCYQIKVIPKSKTKRHFQGYLYIDKKSLRPVMIDGSPAKTHFAIKDFKMKLHFKEQDNYQIYDSGKIDVRAYVPIIQPDRWFITNFKVLETKFIKK